MALEVQPTTAPATDPHEQWDKHPGSAPPDVIRFLEGPQPRGFELGQALRLFWELIRGFRALHFVGPCVTVFGSARFAEGHPHYDLARRVGRALAREGFTVMTGGGPGVMKGANRGTLPTHRRKRPRSCARKRWPASDSATRPPPGRAGGSASTVSTPPGEPDRGAADQASIAVMVPVKAVPGSGS